MIPFICRAEKIDSDELVEGLMFSEDNKFNDCEDYFICEQGTLSVEFNSTQINEETLEISFDGGKHWDSVEKVAEDIALCRIDNF